MRTAFKNKIRLGNNFHFKDRISKDLTSGAVYKCHCGLCAELYYGEYVRHLNVRIGEPTGISTLTEYQVKPTSSLAVDHLLFCNHSASYDDFITCESKRCLLELKENLLIMRDKPSLNGNTSLAPLYLFDRT